MRRRISIGVAVIATVLVGAMGHAAASASEASRVPEAAHKRAGLISGRGGVELGASQRGVLGWFDQTIEAFDMNSGDEFWIDKETAAIWRYRNADASRLDGRKDVGEARAIAAAERYHRRIFGSNRQGRMVRTVERMDRGESGWHYLVSYREEVDGVPTCNVLDLELLPDATLWTLRVWDEDISVSLTPDVERSRAVEVLGAESGMEKWARDEARLVVERSGPGRQHLCWEVELVTGDETLGSSTRGFIDAHDGRLLTWGVSEWDERGR